MSWPEFVRDVLARRGSPADEDVVEELAQHAAAACEAARADGLDRTDAEQHVRALVDAWCQDPRRLRPRSRRAGLVEPPMTAAEGWTGLLHDARYAVRRLRHEPGFAVLAILLVALGIGATTTLASLTYAVLRKPLSWPAADRLVRLAESRDGATHQFPNTITNAAYLAWRDAPETIDSIAAWTPGTYTATIAGNEPERLAVVSTTASLFRVLDVRPLSGAPFTGDDEPETHSRVIVLSYGFWERRFGGRADAIGQTIELNSDPYRIVGVMPQGFAFPTPETQAWIPRAVPPVLSGDPRSRRVSLTRGLARLKPGVTAQQASAEATARARSAPALELTGMALFGTQGPPRVVATPYLAAVTADVRVALYVLVTAVVLLLCAAIANIAGVQLARATTRRRDMTIRAALGAAPARLARQLLTENLVVGLAGGLAGWLLSLALHRALPHVLPPDFPRAHEIAADWRVLAFAIAGAIAASLLFGLAPALMSRRLNLVDSLSEDSLAPVGGSLRSRIGRLRAAIMIGQVAIAAILLIGASLLGRSFLALLHVDRGYEPHHLLTAVVPMGVLKYSGVQRAQSLDALIDRLSHLGGVTAVGAASVMPLIPFEQLVSFQLSSARPGGAVVAVHAAIRSVSPDYFAALGMRVIEGRGFQASDSLTSMPVVVVNRTFSRTYLGGHALGVKLPIRSNDHGAASMEIVGVVEDVRQQTVTDPVQPEIFNTYHQVSQGMSVSAPVIVVRTTGDPERLVPTLRAIVRDENSRIVLDSVMTMEARVLTSLANPRLYALLLTTFAGFALLVTGAGLFGVLSYNVAHRSRVIGIRTALGARPARIVRLVLGQGLAITAAGLAIGVAGAFALTRLVGTMLYGVTAHDAFSFATMPLVVIVIAAVACYLPARVAARLDPLKTLRPR